VNDSRNDREFVFEELNTLLGVTSIEGGMQKQSGAGEVRFKTPSVLFGNDGWSAVRLV
jgi:hypothetical protein